MVPMTFVKANTPRRYWAELSLGFAVMVYVFAVMPGILWTAVLLADLVAAAFVHALYYRQIGRHIQGRFATATPGMGFVGIPFFAAGLVLRGSPVAYWAGPILGLAGFTAMFLFLNRFGKFHTESPEARSGDRTWPRN